MRDHSTRAWRGAALVAVCVVALVLCLASHPVFAAPETGNGQALIRQLEQAYIGIAEKVKPSVVVIEVKMRARPVAERLPFDPEDLPPELRRWFKFELPTPPLPREQGDGSGFIVDASGWVVTNSHVVQDADPKDIEVRLADGTAFVAEAVHTDPLSDVAVVRIDPGNTHLQAIGLGDSDRVQVGQIAVAVGNPFGMGITFNMGVISALGGEISAPARDERGMPIRSIPGLIQTDASVNPGNSGGPLCNIDGQVIGVNTAIVSRSGGSEGVAFAIPVNRARRIWETLIAKGRVERGWLGVELRGEVDPKALAALGSAEGGAFVSRVVPDGPAGKGGVQDGDLIISFQVDPEHSGRTTPIHSSQDLIDAVEQAAPGTPIGLTVLRQGTRQTLGLTIGEFPSELSGGRSRVATAASNPLGLSVGEVSAQRATELGLPSGQGVEVTGIDAEGAAAQEGVREGDVIIQIGETPIHNAQEYQEAVDKVKGAEGVLIVVKRSADDHTATLPIYVPLGS